ncbi:MAG: RNA polymerase sigma factor [Myxococcota bacterium]
MSIDVEYCYERYGPMVLRRCRALLDDEHEAVDAMQDTFVHLLRKSDSLEDRGLSSLLYRMATNVCLNLIRSKRRKPAKPDHNLIERIARAPVEQSRVDDQDQLDDIFSDARESTRTIAVLHLRDGMTLAETADEVGMSVSGVRKRLRKLRSTLPELEDAI